MSKKRYQKRLPTLLPPPPPPAPRRSPEALEHPGRVEPTRTVTPLWQAADGPEDRPAQLPEPTPALRSRASIIAIVLVNLAAVGFLAFAVVSTTKPPPLRGSGNTANTYGTTAPSLASDESYVEMQVRPNGDVVVHQWIRPDGPLRQLRLKLPQVPGADLSASLVKVMADGEQVAGPASITGVGATYAFAPSADVQVSYRLSGAVQRSDSAAGRALAVATTLDVHYAPRAQRETRVVRAPAVLALACTASASEDPMPCGQAEGVNEWRVELTGSRVTERVIAQISLG